MFFVRKMVLYLSLSSFALVVRESAGQHSLLISSGVVV